MAEISKIKLVNETNARNIKDTGAVRFDRDQELDGDAKAQARENIGAGTGNGTYSKPSGGIPKSDLASAVQTSLNKADSALQAHQDISGKENISNKVSSWQTTTNNTHYPTEKLVKDSLDNKVDKVSGKGLSTKDYTEAEQNKLAGIAAGATKVVDSTVSGWGYLKTEEDPIFAASAAAGITAADISTWNSKQPGGSYQPAGNYATLGTDGKVPSSQLPSYVDDVLEYAKLASFPTTGESGKIYIAQDTNKTYRWSGTQYVVISETLAIGTTSTTAAAGDHNHDTVYVKKANVSNKAATLAWNTSSTIATVGDTNITVKLPANPNTDDHVTSVSNHYVPSDGTAIDFLSSGTATRGSTKVITGILVDSAGHITGVDAKVLPASDNTNTSHNHSAGVGLVGSGEAGLTNGTYTYKANLASETLDTNAAISRPSANSTRIYPVIPDKNGNLAVIVPWSDTNTNYYHTPVYDAGLKIGTGTGVADLYVPQATTSALGLVKSTITGTTSGRDYYVEVLSDGKMKVNVPWSDTDTNTDTWRAIKVNGTQKLGTGTDTGAVNFAAGSNVSLTYSNGTITISATDTNTDTNTTYTFEEGTVNGKIKVIPSTGSSSEVSIKGWSRIRTSSPGTLQPGDIWVTSA